MTHDGSFLARHTVVGHAPLVPEIRLHLATEITPIWQATEQWLAANNIEPPFWAFAWPGGQTIARHVLDNPGLVAGRRVLDFAAGCGIAALACARAGAARVDASEIDALAIEALEANARLNGLSVRPIADDVVGRSDDWDLILCGDVFYEAPMSRHILPWLRQRAAETDVWVADPGRAYLPADGLDRLFSIDVPTSLELEDRLVRPTTIYRLRA